MTKEEVFHSLAISVKDYLLGGQLLDALHALQSMAEIHASATFNATVADILADYNRMLDFARQGGHDPLRQQQYLRLTQRTIAALQELRRDHRTQHSDDLYSQTLRHLNDDTESESNNPLHKADNLFHQLWTSRQLSHEEMEHYIRQEASEATAQHITSALTMALLEYFDPNKIVMLAQYADSNASRIRATALIGLCTACEAHGAYIALYPQLEQQIRQVAETHCNEITLIQHFVCITMESERIQQQIQEEIIPNIIRAHQSEHPREGQEGSVTLSLNDPSLDKELRRKIEHSFHKMSRLMRDGMDLNIGTFQALKRFPFFQKLSRWLLPYDPQFTDSDYSAFVSGLSLCDADKYSLTLFLNAAPAEQAKQMKEQLNQQRHGMQAADNNENTSIQQAVRNALQCLTRTLRHSQWAGQWPEVLGNKTLYARTPILAPILNNNAQYLKRSIATYFKYGHYATAHTLLEMQQQLQGATAESYFRLAQCDSQLQQPSSAIHNLNMALQLAPDNEQYLWALQELLGDQKQWHKQSQTLARLEELQPDSEEVLTRQGYCLMKMKQWKEAQQRFYKMEFNNQRVTQSMRAIAWCSLMLGNLPSAHRYYERLLANADTATWEDYLNQGHVAWLQGDTQRAIDLYRTYAREYLRHTPRATHAIEPFNRDRHVLLAQGISAMDINLMRDLIAQSL